MKPSGMALRIDALTLVGGETPWADDTTGLQRYLETVSCIPSSVHQL